MVESSTWQVYWTYWDSLAEGLQGVQLKGFDVLKSENRRGSGTERPKKKHTKVWPTSPSAYRSVMGGISSI
jgi:hypothetical protein